MKKHIKIIGMLFIAVFALQTVSASGSNIKKETFKVSGNCEMCKKRIESSVKVDGVEAAQWNPDTKMMKVKYNADEISIDKIYQLIADAGYDTDKVKGSEQAYNNLPKCCQYRSPKSTK